MTDEFLALFQQGEYLTFTDVKTRSGFCNVKIKDGFNQLLAKQLIKSAGAWVFWPNIPKWHKTSVYFLPETPSPPEIISYPYMEYELDRADPRPYMGAYGESKNTFINWRNRMIKLGLIDEVSFRTKTKRPKLKKLKRQPFEAYLKYPTAKRWLMEMLTEIRDIAS